MGLSQSKLELIAYAMTLETIAVMGITSIVMEKVIESVVKQFMSANIL